MRNGSSSNEPPIMHRTEIRFEEEHSHAEPGNDRRHPPPDLLRRRRAGGLRLPRPDARPQERQEDGALRRRDPDLPPLLRQPGRRREHDPDRVPVPPGGLDGQARDQPGEVDQRRRPAESIGYWRDRLKGAGIAVDEVERFGTQRLEFAHPCGIPYQMVGETREDTREPYGGGDVPAEHAIRGAWGTTTSVREPEPMDDFLREAFNAEQIGSEGAHHQYRLTGSRPRPDPRARRGARPAAGHVALRRGHDPPPRLRRRLLREPAARQGLHRRPRLHRRLRRQGPRLLLQRLPAHARRRAVRARLLDRGRASRSTSPSTSSARTCASRRTGRTAAPRSTSWSRSTPSRRSE